MACSWIGVGVSYPDDSTALSTFSLRPSSLNFILFCLDGALRALEARIAPIALFIRGRALRATQRRTRARSHDARSYRVISSKVNEIANFPGSARAAGATLGLANASPGH